MRCRDRAPDSRLLCLDVMYQIIIVDNEFGNFSGICQLNRAFEMSQAVDCQHTSNLQDPGINFFHTRFKLALILILLINYFDLLNLWT